MNLRNIKDAIAERYDGLKTYALHKRGALGMSTVLAIVGLLVVSKVAIALLPGILANFSSTTIWGSGVGGVIITSVFSVLIVVGFLVMLMKGMGLKVGKGGM